MIVENTKPVNMEQFHRLEYTDAHVSLQENDWPEFFKICLCTVFVMYTLGMDGIGNFSSTVSDKCN